NVSSPKDAEKKQKGTVLKKVEQTEKKVIIFVTLKKQWKVVQVIYFLVSF
ncbi:hypothetical protein B296_00046930, partial [Ensete ventricosum]